MGKIDFFNKNPNLSPREDYCMTIAERVARDTLLGTIRKNWEKRNHAQKNIGRVMSASTGTLSVSGAHV